MEPEQPNISRGNYNQLPERPDYALQANQLGSANASLDQPSQEYPGQQGQVVSDAQAIPPPAKSKWKRYLIIILLAALLLGGILLLLRGGGPSTSTKAGDFGVLDVPLDRFAPEEDAGDDQTLTVSGKLQVGNSIVLTPSVQPADPVAGQMYYDQTTNQLAYYNGTAFITMAGGSVIQNTFNTTNTSTGEVTAFNGTPGALAKFTGAQTIGDSIASDQGGYLQVRGGVNAVPAFSSADFNFWPNNDIPDNPDAIDAVGPRELGVKFNTDVPGFINSVRFYRGATSAGPYIASLWANDGTLLARKTFNVTGFGWQEVFFDAPVAISSDTTYVASYYSSGAGYAADNLYFGSSINNGPLHALASGLDGVNGVFKYGPAPVFPNEGFQSTNYWVDVGFTGTITTLESRYRINGAQISSGDLSNNTDLAKRSSAQVFSGHNIFRNSSDSISAFDIQKADTTRLFSVNTTDSQIVIGPTGSSLGVILVLGRGTLSFDPTGTDGAMYYNVIHQSFRCYRDGQWSECGGTTASHGFSLYDEFLGGHTTSFTGNIGNLGWNAQAIGANGNLNFNPSTPTPSADRPGILDLQTTATANQGTTLMLANGSGASMLIGPSHTVRTAVAVGSTADQVLRVGLHNQTTAATQPLSGVWWEANPAANANWRYCYGDGVAATCANSLVPIAANTWVRLEIRVIEVGAGTSAVNFYINSEIPATLTAITVDSTTRLSPAYSCYTTTTAAKNCYWDYFQLKATTSTAR